jgi:uncharacterized protein YjiS (DUF1127 family)
LPAFRADGTALPAGHGKESDVTTSTIRSASASEWGQRLSCWMTRVMTYWARRETIKMLRELDDHQLRDIGLPRHQIESTVKRRRDGGAALHG